MEKKKLSDLECLEKIIYHAQWLKECFSDVDDENIFVNDRRMTDIGSFNVSQIGEYVCKIDDNILKKYPEIPWNHIMGMRHRIVHDYDGVNNLKVWDVIITGLDPLIETVECMIRDIKENKEI